MYTLMNVVQALNSNQSFMPYTQSKVTRILQDSLCKTSGAVVIACLEEVYCQDAVFTLSLAARLSQVTTQVANEQCRRSASVTSFKRVDVNLLTRGSAALFVCHLSGHLTRASGQAESRNRILAGNFFQAGDHHNPAHLQSGCSTAGLL
uniref:Kinesin motor domain-containing protein n=1 Tax=Aegilops tauschii subsp. strangulata TaxID=200361 RepID=A0A453AZ98_AEGTS